MEPSKKSPEMEKFLDEQSMRTYGRKRSESIRSDICVSCGKPVKEFKDEQSKREYLISGLGQDCQDKIFR